MLVMAGAVDGFFATGAVAEALLAPVAVVDAAGVALVTVGGTDPDAVEGLGAVAATFAD